VASPFFLPQTLARDAEPRVPCLVSFSPSFPLFFFFFPPRKRKINSDGHDPLIPPGGGFPSFSFFPFFIQFGEKKEKRALSIQTATVFLGVSPFFLFFFFLGRTLRRQKRRRVYGNARFLFSLFLLFLPPPPSFFFFLSSPKERRYLNGHDSRDEVIGRPLDFSSPTLPPLSLFFFFLERRD